MIRLRAEHYWTARKCYDAQLREQPELAGRIVLRATQDRRGKIIKVSPQKGGVPDKRKHKKRMTGTTVGTCIASALRGATLPLARKGGATFSFSIDLYPGDAPLPELDTKPSPVRIDLQSIQQKFLQMTPVLGACFEEASTRKPGLWGRLALRGELTQEGRLRSLQEIESTFPDTEAGKCVQKHLEQAEFPPPREGGSLVVFPMRWAPHP